MSGSLEKFSFSAKPKKQQLKTQFNNALKRYNKIETLIESQATQEKKNELFYQHEKEWRHLLGELNRLRYVLGEDGYDIEVGYEI